MSSGQVSAELAGKVAIVTGGASGIGRALAEKLTAAGARICIADIDAEKAAAFAEELGDTACAISCDISDAEQVESLIAQVIAWFGRHDIMHNNAALLDFESLAADKDMRTIPTDMWDRVMQVTRRGTMLGCRFAVDQMMKRGGGSIINTSSMVSLAVDNNIPAYSTAKAGIDLLTQWVAAKYGRDGIRCNAVRPQ
ncbi:putative 3-alpha(or 20-beta)-hydroxysteroid dehydrogenase [Novosphingobium sp. 9U]|nr:putative 3-alpha(or 20-beta)-hydroxysteroid dehydrogenase [Novosphingobium sp. 9U]